MNSTTYFLSGLGRNYKQQEILEINSRELQAFLESSDFLGWNYGELGVALKL